MRVGMRPGQAHLREAIPKELSMYPPDRLGRRPLVAAQRWEVRKEVRARCLEAVEIRLERRKRWRWW